MNNYILPLISEYEKFANPEIAIGQQKYMRNLFKYYGIKTDQRRAIQKQFFKEYSLPDIKDLQQIATELWNLEFRELHYFAMELIEKMIKKVDISFVQFLEYLILNNSWWDSVDMIAPTLVKNHFERFPELIPEYSKKWINSDNIWLQRSAILFQLNRKKNTDLDLLFQLILIRQDSKEFFVQKAMGWILRQYAKTDSKPILEFVAQNPQLPTLTKKEALKHF